MQVLKSVIVLIILLSTVSLYSTRHEVSLDGTHAYTSIQTAIDTATDNDTILVYPGRYLENLNFNGKDLSLLSMYVYSNDPQDIEDTFINGQPIALELVVGLYMQEIIAILCFQMYKYIIIRPALTEEECMHTAQKLLGIASIDVVFLRTMHQSGWIFI